jgi:uncharacterized repeat protein (TIGR01451 family)
MQQRLPSTLAGLLWLAVAAAAASPPATAQPALKASVLSFVDVNGNGVLDCGEPVILATTYATRNSGTPALTGTLLLPAAGTSGLIYQPGTLRVDPDLTVGCQGTVVHGNSPEDLSGEVDFSCPADPLDNNSWTVVATWRALYYNTVSPTFTATAHAATSDGRTFDAAANGTATAACSGAPSHLSLQKTAAGTGAPGSVLLYTLTARDLSGLGAGGLQLADTVPANTRFDAAASSAGWACAPDGGPGSQCHNQVGNLDPNGSLSRSFAVVVDNPLPAGVSSIANTGCVLEGPATVAACASVATPTAGAPALRVGKALISGTGAPGATLVYGLAAQNAGNQGATAVALGETVPAATRFAAAASSPGWTCVPAGGGAGAACTLQLGPLAAGATAHAAFAVTLASPLPAGVSAIANTGCATVPGFAPVCASLSTPTTGAPILSLTKTYPGPPLAPGATLVFQLAYANTGNQDAAPVSLVDTVPDHTSFLAGASSPGWSCAPAAGSAGATCTLQLGAVAGGASGARAFAVRADDPLPAGVTRIANAACVTIQTIEAAGGNACSQAETPPPVPPPPPPPPPPPAPAVAASLADTEVGAGGDGTPALPGDPITYTLVVGNPSQAPAHDLRIGVALDPHSRLQAGSVSTSGGTVLLGNGPGDASPVVAVPLLGTGATVVVTFRVTVASSLPPGLANLSAQATVTGSDVGPTLSDDPETPEPLDPTLTPIATAAGPPPVNGTPIPTLGGIGITTLVALLAAAGLARLRRPGRGISAMAAAGGPAAPGGTVRSAFSAPATGGQPRPR